MLALRYYGQRDIRLEDVELRELKDDEVLLKVTDAGISQTQINEFIEGPFIIDKLPIIPSQEFGGIVKKVANGDDSIVGKMVAVLPLVSCGKCSHCLSKKEEFCEELAYHGLLGLDGGFAEYAVVDRKNLYFTDRVELLTFIEPILVGIHSANIFKRLDEIEGKKVLVLGAGAVGVSVATVWRDFFKADVTLCDILEKRVNRAKSCGLNTVKFEELFDKFDVVVDAAGMDIEAGDNVAFLSGFNFLKKGGVLLNIGTYFHPLEMVPSSILLNEQLIMTSMVYNSNDVKILDEVINSLKVDFAKLIEEIRLKDIIENGYYAIEIDKSKFTRIVVKP